MTWSRSRFCLPGGRPLGRGREEIAFGVVAELVDEDAEAPGGVAEASGRLGRGKTLDKKGS